MTKIIFINYRQGFGGENLSHRISQHPICRPLIVKKTKGRTIILNDIFDKKLLDNHDMDPLYRSDIKKYCKKLYQQNIKKIKSENKIIVSPSHRNIDILKEIFTDAYYIKIEAPLSQEEVNKVKDHIYNDFWLYKTNNIQDYVGEIYSKIYQYQPDVDKDRAKSIVDSILKKYSLNLSFGQIITYINGLDPTLENQKKLFTRLYQNKIYTKEERQIDDKIFYVPYNQYKTVSPEEILEYFKLI